MQPELLLVKAGWMIGVAKEKTVFDQVDVGRARRDSGMLGKELMREYEESPGARARGHTRTGFYVPQMEWRRKSASNERMVQRAVLIQLV